jgi:hypothetical protein
MSSKDNLEIKKIYYDRHSKFEIIPINPRVDLLSLEEFPASSELCEHSSFWVYHPESQSIIVNESIENVHNDIFEQFVNIFTWLNKNGYSLRGSFIYHIGKCTEFIMVDGQTEHIEHFVIVNEEITNELINESVIENAKMKINDIHRQKNNQTHEQQTIVIDNTVIREEHNALTESIQNRILTLENKVNHLAKENNYLRKTVKIVGILFVGFVFAYFASNTQTESKDDANQSIQLEETTKFVINCVSNGLYHIRDNFC